MTDCQTNCSGSDVLVIIKGDGGSKLLERSGNVANQIYWEAYCVNLIILNVTDIPQTSAFILTST